MNKKLENLFDLAPVDNTDESENLNLAEIQQDVIEIRAQLTSAEKIDFALTNVTGLDEHDREMDDIALKAARSYQDIINLGMSSTEMNAGKILDSAANMLKIALEAKDAKVTKKLKMIDLMIKKHKIERDNEAPKSDDDDSRGSSYDRNELLRVIKEGALDAKPKENGK